MDRLGTFALVLGLGLAVYGLIASVIGVRRSRPLLVESARTSAYSLLGVVAAANGAMLAAILANDFRIQYVAENSSRATPTFFKILALWSADEGSLLLWNLVLAGYIAAVAFRFRRRKPETFPWALTVGLVLGALWSYGVLGWGGYWAWDPVENVALLPWLMATAFLHSVIIQERRGMLKVWNLSLIVGAFALTTFGTFLTRGSILLS